MRGSGPLTQIPGSAPVYYFLSHLFYFVLDARAAEPWLAVRQGQATDGDYAPLIAGCLSLHSASAPIVPTHIQNSTPAAT